MSLMDWDDSLDVHVPSMNDWHKKILTSMNKLFELNSSGASHADMKTALENLMNIAVTHFKEEEAYMQSIGFPECELHARIHKDITKKLTDHHAAYSKA